MPQTNHAAKAVVAVRRKDLMVRLSMEATERIQKRTSFPKGRWEVRARGTLAVRHQQSFWLYF